MSASPADPPRGRAGGGGGPPPPPRPPLPAPPPAAPGGADSLAFASLSVSQPASGYRFSVDSVLLARFAAPWCTPAVLDLGTGSGIVLLLLARLCPALSRGVGIEIQEELFRHASANVEANGLSGRLRAVLGDLREGIPGEAPGSFGLAVANPPFRRAGSGRRNPDRRREVARHEVACTLPALLAAAARALADGGRLAVVFPAARAAELVAEAEAGGLRPERLRFVHPFEGREASRLLALFRKGRRGRDVTVEAPLVEYAAPGRYHPDVEAAFGGLLRK